MGQPATENVVLGCCNRQVCVFIACQSNESVDQPKSTRLLEVLNNNCMELALYYSLNQFSLEQHPLTWTATRCPKVQLSKLYPLI